jgi:hypothetical protein
MKYKVGDKIRIKDDLVEGEKYKVWCNDSMIKFKGKECIIEKIEKTKDGNIYYEIDIDDYGWSFTDDMFDLVEEYDKQFTKDDLKPFYVVEFRNGKLAIVCETNKGKILGNINNEGTYVRLSSDYSDNLQTDSEPMYDVMKVYGYSDWVRSVFTVSTEDRELLWERDKINPRIKEIEDEIKVKNDELSKLIDELNNLK